MRMTLQQFRQENPHLNERNSDELAQLIYKNAPGAQKYEFKDFLNVLDYEGDRLATTENPGILSTVDDLGRGVTSGALRAAGNVADFAQLKGAAKLLGGAAEGILEGQSDWAKVRRSVAPFGEDENGSLTVNKNAFTNPGTLFLQGAEILGDQAPLIASGLGLGSVVRAGAKALGLTTKAAQTAASRGATAGYVASGAAMAGGSSGNEAEQIVSQMPHEKLLESEVFKEILRNRHQQSGSLQEAYQLARSDFIEATKQAAMYDPVNLIASGAGGVMSGKLLDGSLMKMFGGEKRWKNALKGALLETPQEAVQEGIQQLRINDALIGKGVMGDDERMGGVLPAAATGALYGAPMGAGFGAIGTADSSQPNTKKLPLAKAAESIHTPQVDETRTALEISQPATEGELPRQVNYVPLIDGERVDLSSLEEDPKTKRLAYVLREYTTRYPNNPDAFIDQMNTDYQNATKTAKQKIADELPLSKKLHAENEKNVAKGRLKEIKNDMVAFLSIKDTLTLEEEPQVADVSPQVASNNPHEKSVVRSVIESLPQTPEVGHIDSLLMEIESNPTAMKEMEKALGDMKADALLAEIENNPNTLGLLAQSLEEIRTDKEIKATPNQDSDGATPAKATEQVTGQVPAEQTKTAGQETGQTPESVKPQEQPQPPAIAQTQSPQQPQEKPATENTTPSVGDTVQFYHAGKDGWVDANYRGEVDGKVTVVYDGKNWTVDKSEVRIDSPVAERPVTTKPVVATETQGTINNTSTSPVDEAVKNAIGNRRNAVAVTVTDPKAKLDGYVFVNAGTKNAKWELVDSEGNTKPVSPFIATRVKHLVEKGKTAPYVAGSAVGNAEKQALDSEPGIDVVSKGYESKAKENARLASLNEIKADTVIDAATFTNGDEKQRKIVGQVFRKFVSRVPEFKQAPVFKVVKDGDELFLRFNDSYTFNLKAKTFLPKTELREGMTVRFTPDVWGGASRNQKADIQPDVKTESKAADVQSEAKGDGKPAAQKATEAKVKTQTEVKTEEKPAKPAEKIDDVGEKIGGAKKDTWRSSFDKEYSDAELNNMPLSKIWPKEDIDKMDDKTAAIATVFRNKIPNKPRSGYKLAQWVKDVKAIRAFMARVGTMDNDAALDLIRKSNNDAVHVRILQSIPRDQWDRIGEAQVYSKSYTYNDNGERVPRANALIQVDENYKRIDLNASDSIIEMENVVIDVASEMLKTDRTATGKSTSTADAYEIRGSKDKGFAVFRKGDKEYRPLTERFPTSKEALAYRKNNIEALAEAWEKIKERDNVKKSDVRSKEERPRAGSDYRKGKDVTPEQFADTFGFRGVEFGNWVEQGKRQADLNDAYDALMDLANIVGIPPKAISLNGTLGLGFGSRGGGKASAHYEADKTVINLTKTRGSGSLAHEWFHALDNYFSRKRGVTEFTGDEKAFRDANYITHKPEQMYVHKDYPAHPKSRAYLEAARKRNPNNEHFQEKNWSLDPNHPEGVRPEVERAFANLVEKLNDSPMSERSAKNDKGSNDYWSRTLERASRAFENFVIEDMTKNGYHNDYLANVVGAFDFRRNQDRYPYLRPDEIAPIAEAFQNLFDTVQTRETDKGVELFSRSKSDIPTVAKLTGDEIQGDDLFAAAREYYRENLQGTVAHREEIGDIRFTSKGWGKTKDGLKRNPLKVKLIPSVRDIIENGRYHGRNEEVGRDDNVVAFHYFDGIVSIDGENVHAGVTVAEDDSGNLYYNVNHNPQELWDRKKETRPVPRISAEGGGFSMQPEVSITDNMESDSDFVNIHIFDNQAATTPLANAHTASTLKDAVDKAFSKVKGFADLLMGTGKFKIISRAQMERDLTTTTDVKYSADGRVLGYVKDGVAHLVADNIGKDHDVKGLMLHEVGVHLRQLGQNDAEFQGILKQFEKMRTLNPRVRAAFDRVPKETEAHLITEEALGYFVEANPDVPLSQKFIAWVRKQLRALGSAIKGADRLRFVKWANELTAADIVVMAQSATENAVNMERGDGQSSGIRYSRSSAPTNTAAQNIAPIPTPARIDSTAKSLMKGIGLFESATDRLRRSKHPMLIDLGNRVDRFYDRVDERTGFVNGRIKPLLDKVTDDESTKLFAEYWKHHDNGRKAEADAVIANHPELRALIEEVKAVYFDMGTINQTIKQPDGFEGILVADPKAAGGWRKIGRIRKGEFWPRAIRPEVQEVLRNPANNIELWNEIVAALLDGGHIKEPMEAMDYLQSYFTTEIKNDYFAGVERARGAKLPEIFYDYTWTAFQKYTTKWATRVSQIEQFGQATTAGTKDLFAEVAGQSFDPGTIDYIRAIESRVYNRQSPDTILSLMDNLNILATAMQLGNPATAILNVIGGSQLTTQLFGWKTAARAYAKLTQEWQEIQQTGISLGVLGKDVMNILRDTESTDTYFDAAGQVKDKLSKFAAWTMKWGGYTPTENIIRSHALAAGMIQLSDALQAWNANMNSDDSKKYLKFMEQNGIHADKLIAENGKGEETGRFLRLMVNIPQGSYRIDQVPIYVDTRVGRFLFKYQKFATQVSRMFWKNMLVPFVDAIKSGDTKEMVRTLVPILRYFATAFVGGTAVLTARAALFGLSDPGADWEEIEEAMKQEDRAYLMALMFSRAHASLMAGAAFGFFGNYIQMGMDITDQQRVKSPLDPPGLATISAVTELLMRYIEQGTLTGRDIDQIGQKAFAFYRSYKRAGMTAGIYSDIDLNEVRLEKVRRDINDIRQVTRRYASHMGIESKRTSSGRFGKTERSPLNQAVYEAVLLGDRETARQLIREAKRNAGSFKERQSIHTSLQASLRVRQPILIAGAPSNQERMKFLRWAKLNLPESKYKLVYDYNREYLRNVRAVGL
ncbi:LPD5 domain-containing protein [Chrysiogenes arsenatis]|uniref:LPD3 domain-containing protein n=1 Tax=Chrysiogenes arsenatis TaxID=309797 RepID=UPI0005526C38|nr:LPD5 domain-containing protein [Chrysiogenes arsenatis]